MSTKAEKKCQQKAGRTSQRVSNLNDRDLDVSGVGVEFPIDLKWGGEQIHIKISLKSIVIKTISDAIYSRLNRFIEVIFGSRTDE